MTSLRKDRLPTSHTSSGACTPMTVQRFCSRLSMRSPLPRHHVGARGPRPCAFRPAPASSQRKRALAVDTAFSDLEPPTGQPIHLRCNCLGSVRAVGSVVRA
ncbi:hypothetical protein PsYK624_070670 [Phanerochaete sordida]|uniref:Uncharacterized protein n=1 Tax=Phanerochaete sordida TaxID=48140 RepID=A0A9P3G9S5_9APHY|nr:hypothetical protein PsYK624_070670 [Phanerochaete sordida]